MFIELCSRWGSSLQRSETMVRATQLPRTLRSAGAQTVVGSEVYKHLAPSEPEHHSVSADILLRTFGWPCLFPIGIYSNGL